MFNQVRVSNFKSLYGEHTIDLRRISVFIGPNGAGKSSVLQSILLWCQSGGGQFSTSGTLVNLGDFDDVALSEDIVPQLGVTVTRELLLPALVEGNDLTRVEVKSDVSVESPAKSTVQLTSGPLTLRSTGFNSEVEPSQYMGGTPDETRFRSEGDITRQINRSRGNARFEGDINRFLDVFRDALSDVRFVPALRGFSSAKYPLGQGVDRNFATRVVPDENASRLATSLAYDGELRAAVSDLLRRLTGVGVGNVLIPDRTVSPVSLRDTGSGQRSVAPTNEGFGTNQLIHLVAQMLVTPKGGTVLIEEPETHLHPSAQMRLGLWAAEHAINEDKQLLIATHSERFLAALLWQVRQEVLVPMDLIVYYFSLKDGGTLQRRLSVTTGGIIQGSFREFFETPEEMPEWDVFYRGLHQGGGA